MILNVAAYHFTAVDNPHALAEEARVRAVAAGLLGTVLVEGEGVNLFLAGAGEAVRTWLDWLRAEPRLAGLVLKESFSRAQPFQRLKVKVKPELISFRRADASPLQGRAPTVAPTDLARWIGQGCDDNGRRLVLDRKSVV